MQLYFWRNLGPGFVIAATGLGAGDLIAATVAGVQFHTALLWAVLLGALLKGALNEGLARWQLATGTTLLEGWIHRLPAWVRYYFGAYLLLWSFLVAAALMGACGLAAHALFPGLSVRQWALLHSLTAALLVLYGRYAALELLMKVFIGLMFVTVLAATARLPLDWPVVLAGFVPTVPADSLKLLLGVIGGVGGSVTLLCYGYWMREKGWRRVEQLHTMRVDLWLAYLVTALFGICIVILAAHSRPEALQGTAILIALADQLEQLLGPAYALLFLVGFWGAVFSSMLGVWHGVPYLFADFLLQTSRAGTAPGAAGAEVSLTGTTGYRCFLFFLALPPFVMLYLEKPIWLVVTYAVAGAFFMPFLAATLLYMNNRAVWLGPQRNGLPANLLLLASLGLFAVLLAQKLAT